MPQDKIPKPVVLVVLDGWGLNPQRKGNATALAKIPTMDRLFQEYPHTKLDAAGEAVGLPAGQMGNSEVGHLNLGSGIIVYQELTRIDKAIGEGTFFRNEVLTEAMSFARERGSELHLMGLLGPGGVHSHSNHLYALLRMAKEQRVQHLFVHAFLDGRDTPPQSALSYMEELEAKTLEIGIGEVASVSGRYYAMDRDNRWDRVQKAYEAIVRGQGLRASSAQEAIRRSYDEGVTDEFVLPTVIVKGDQPVATLGDGDAAIFFNFRADRGRELTKAIVLPDFTAFERGPRIQDLYFATLTQYEEGLPVHVAFPANDVKHPLARILSDRGLKQFHTAETEKYPHVTFFFNGGEEKPFPGEDRVLVPSPRVATYDLLPEMSAFKVTDVVVERVESGSYDFIIVNYANGDMVGHTGILAAAIRAAETVDECIKRVKEATLEKSGVLLITADHGNLEEMIDPETGGPFTAHTTDPVPFILVAPDDSPLRRVRLRESGILADVAPTILQIMRIPKAPEMTGKSLIEEGTKG
ncbi:MAG: 2,3-bisphosphoglycerate-independent phosphoglycerate mutase [Chloroflexi bacterium]|nr:2,3-bisphosphoglycerate-independent phosphoglycerate mutase [Chloroflexota bacterium]